MTEFAPLLGLLAEVPDPRRAQGQIYKLPHVLLFSILAAGIMAEQAAHPQPDGDGVRAPGQIGERALVSAVDALDRLPQSGQHAVIRCV